MSTEVEELEEHAEHAKANPALAPVTVPMAILAVLVATVSLLGHRSSTEEIILQNKVTDQWGYYQAKNIRQHTDEMLADLAGVMAAKDAEAAAKLQEKFRAQVDRYKDEKQEQEAKARELEQEFFTVHQKTDRFDLAEVFLEVALVITSITLLSGRRVYWHLGLLFGAIGLALSLSAHLIK